MGVGFFGVGGGVSPGGVVGVTVGVGVFVNSGVGVTVGGDGEVLVAVGVGGHSSPTSLHLME